MTSSSGRSEATVERRVGVWRRLFARGESPEESRLRAELARQEEALARIERVCQAAAAGDLEPRVLGVDTDDRLGRVAGSVNHLLDLMDAYLRESSASLTAAHEGRYYRRFLERGMPGSFRAGARVSNRAGDEMKAKEAALEEAGVVLGHLADGDFTRRLEGDYAGAYARTLMRALISRFPENKYSLKIKSTGL